MPFTNSLPDWGSILNVPIATDLLFAATEFDWARLVEGVTHKGTFARWQGSHGIKPYVCVPDPCGDDAISPKEVRNCLWRVDKQECILNFRNFFNHDVAPYNNPPGTRPLQPVELAVRTWAGETERHVASFLPIMLWQMDSSQPLEDGCISPLGGTPCDGWIRLLKENGAILINNATTPAAVTPWTPANIIAELTKVYESIPTVMLGQPGAKNDLAIFMPWSAKQTLAVAYANAAQIFLQGPLAQGALGLQKIAADGNAQYELFGIPIVFTHGLPDLHMVCTWRENLMIITDRQSDMENPLRILNFTDTTGADVLLLTGSFFLGAAVYKEEEAVLYTPTP